MIRWFPLLLLLLAAPAAAQNPTCPTRPPGDSTNACASTAFVTQGFIPSTGAFTPNNPLIGALSGGGITQGTRQGTTTVFPSIDGTSINGQCAVFDSNGGLSSTPCTASGSGTVGAGLVGNLAVYTASTSVAGLVNGAQGTTLASGGVGNQPIWTPAPISVTAFGAKCDASTDDTTAIVNAIAATPSGGTLLFPPGQQCEVSGSGSNIFLVNRPIVINCQYGLIDYTGTSNTTSMFHFQPVGTGDWWPFRVTQCQFNGHLHLADLIIFDTSNSNLTEITQCEVDHVWDLTGHGAGGGYSIFVNNPGTNTNGGSYHCNFHDSVFQGLFFSLAGDSLLVKNNYLSGPTFGVWANLITGAAGLVITDNSNVAACPILIDAAAGNVIITNNEFEQEITNTCPHNAIVDLRGNTAIPQVTFTGNSDIALAGTGNPYPLYLGNVSQSYIESNNFTSATALVPCIQVTAGATTIIGAANVFNGCTTTKVNGAGGTINTITTHSSYP